MNCFEDNEKGLINFSQHRLETRRRVKRPEDVDDYESYDDCELISLL